MDIDNCIKGKIFKPIVFVYASLESAFHKLGCYIPWEI